MTVHSEGFCRIIVRKVILLPFVALHSKKKLLTFDPRHIFAILNMLTHLYKDENCKDDDSHSQRPNKCNTEKCILFCCKNNPFTGRVAIYIQSSNH